MKIEVIDVTPTWRVAATLILTALENGTPEGKRLATLELLRMADLADKYVAQQKNRR